MDENNLISELKTTSSEEEEKLEKIANAMEEKARTEPREVVSMLHGSGEENFKKAAFVVLELGDLAFAPLLDSLNEDPPEDYVWDMETLVDIQISHRHKLGKILNAMLLDTREVPMPEYPMEEEQPIPRRVCDEAYLMLRKLLSFEETEDELFLNSKAFLDLSDEERDAEIQRVKSTDRWIPLTEYFFETED